MYFQYIKRNYEYILKKHKYKKLKINGLGRKCLAIIIIIIKRGKTTDKLEALSWSVVVNSGSILFLLIKID